MGRSAKPSPEDIFSEANGYSWVEHEGRYWMTLAGRWTECPKCDRPFTYREFLFGQYGACSWCRPDLLPPLDRKAEAKARAAARKKK